MVTLSAERLTGSKVISIESRRQVGALGLEGYKKGINSSLSHLIDLIKYGEQVVAGIEEDIVTKIAERLRHPFVNKVDFISTGDDFVSVIEGTSMFKMNKNCLSFYQVEAIYDPSKQIELQRAEAELGEVVKLIEWFEDASTDSYMIFESLPIGVQTEAKIGIYQKTSEGKLRLNLINLFNPTTELFNELRTRLGADKTDCNDPIEFLQNNYEIQMPQCLDSSEDFITTYSSLYDTIMAEKKPGQYNFGKEVVAEEKIVDALEEVRKYPELTAIYIETLDRLIASDGRMSEDLAELLDKLKLPNDQNVGHKLSVKSMKSLLDGVIYGITSAIKRGDDKILKKLRSANVNVDTKYDIIAHYCGQDRSEGVTYSDALCPTADSSQNGTESGSGMESNLLFSFFNVHEKLPGFGQEKMGVCRINNCPNRGDPNKLPKRTVVGGCDVCVDCHLYFMKNKKSPEREYADKLQKQKAKAEKEMKRQKREQERVAEVVRLESIKHRKNAIKYQKAA